MKKFSLKRATLALAGLALGLVACEPVPTVTVPTDTSRTTWQLVGGDEFDGTALDTTKWRAYNNTYGDTGHQLACLTPNNVKVSGGTLKITAKKQAIVCPGGASRSYSSGFIGSREAGKYYPGHAVRYIMRAKLPHNQGLWPAFWLRHRSGTSTAAVDVMDYFHSQVPGKTTATLHLDGRTNVSKRSVAVEDPAISTSGWHNWRVDTVKGPDGVKFDFYLDGVLYHSYVDSQHLWDDKADPDAMFDIAINLAVGGDWIGKPDGVLGELPDLKRCSISGTFPGGCAKTKIQRVDWTRAADATYEVDWVRVYRSSAPTVAPTTTTTVPPTTTTTVPPTTTTTVPPTTTTTVPPTTTTTTAPTPTPSWHVIGGDEFNGSTVDTAKWRPYFNTYGDGNNELACLMPKNLNVSNGTLKIQARKETVTCSTGTTEHYTSGFIGSREVGKYFPRTGRFEIRARLPHAQGLWPAFWLRHRNGSSTAEVDIMEYFHSEQPGRTRGSLHSDGRYNFSRGTAAFEPTTASPSGWHTWRVDIAEVATGMKFTYYLDGVQYHSVIDTQHHWTAKADANATWDIAVNLAVGGNWVGRPDGILGALEDVGRCAQGGTYPNACNTTGLNRVNWADPASTTYEVDWVRVSSWY